MDRGLVVLAGTRPEALKLAPLYGVLQSPAEWWWTAQQMTIPASVAGLPWRRLPPPAHPLRRRQLEQFLLRCIAGLLNRQRPRALLVQGDTASAFAGALAARDAGIDVIHLEAGLRSGDIRSPFPEEAYRRAITRIAALHLAPSALAVAQLRAEGVPAPRIVHVGSTAVDGLPTRAQPQPPIRYDLLVDLHRRENSGRAIDRLADALRSLVRSGWRVALVDHPNRHWVNRWDLALGTDAGLIRLPPMEREAWLAQARAARCVLTDSGGAAEELPYLGVPLLIYRRHTERPEAITSGHAHALDPDAPGLLASRLASLIESHRWPDDPWPFAVESPYGDGRAATRAAAAIDFWLQRSANSASCDAGVLA